MSRGLARRPVLGAILGALVIAFSAILVDLANVSPAAAAVYRCAYALPALGALAWWEDRRHGRRSWRERRFALAAGTFFAADLITWHHAIADVGAGLATVLGNLQVVIVPFLALAVLREPVPRRILRALPLVCAGVVLVSGALESGAYGADPPRGVLFGALTGLTYAAFLLIQRHGSRDLRRPAGPLFDMTLVCTVVAAVADAGLGEGDLVPRWPSAGWLVLLALSSQVLGWLLITVSLPRLPAALTSLSLTIQPVGSVALAVVLLGQHPSALQLAGVVCILAGLASVALRPRGVRTPLRPPVTPQGESRRDAQPSGPRVKSSRSWRRFGRPSQNSIARGRST
jgi:drug/metabolite transporter (DMT)-like permease